MIKRVNMNLLGCENMNGEKENELGVECYQNEDYTGALNYWQKSMELGNLEAKYHIANLYYFGEGVEIDYTKAFEYFFDCATSNEEGLHVTNSCFNVANAYFKGEAVEENLEKAFAWYHRAADLGHPSACFNIGASYFRGDPYNQDFDKAFKYLMVAANDGFAIAQYMIGVLYTAGRGCNQDIEAARYWLTEASNQGDENAKMVLENLPKVEEEKTEEEKRLEEYKKYFKGVEEINDPMELADMEYVSMDNISEVMNESEYDISKDDIDIESLTKEELLNLAIEGNRKAQYYHAMKVFEDDNEEGVKWFAKSAANGYNEAMYAMGICYINGAGVSEDFTKGIGYIAKSAKNNNVRGLHYIANYYHSAGEYEKMVDIYLKLANELDDTISCATLGGLYLYGDLVNKDYGLAKYYLDRAYEAGEEGLVLTNLALVYFMGDEKYHDIDKSIEFFNKAAEQNEGNAQYYLGLLYENGMGVEKDIEMAKKYYKLAMENDIVTAKEKLESLEK